MAVHHHLRGDAGGVRTIPQVDLVFQTTLKLFSMKLISWNVRGLNNPGKYRMIKNMIQKERPQILFLQETRCNSIALGTILTKAWPGCQLVAVDGSGSSRGLTIVWDSQSISLANYHVVHNLIQATFHFIGTNIHGHLSNVFFPQD